MMDDIIRPKGHFKAVWRDISTGETGVAGGGNLVVTNGKNQLIDNLLKTGFSFDGRAAPKQYIDKLKLGNPTGTPTAAAAADTDIEDAFFTKELYNGTAANSGVTITTLDSGSGIKITVTMASGDGNHATNPGTENIEYKTGGLFLDDDSLFAKLNFLAITKNNTRELDVIWTVEF